MTFHFFFNVPMEALFYPFINYFQFDIHLAVEKCVIYNRLIFSQFIFYDECLYFIILHLTSHFLLYLYILTSLLSKECVLEKIFANLIFVLLFVVYIFLYFTGLDFVLKLMVYVSTKKIKPHQRGIHVLCKLAFHKKLVLHVYTEYSSSITVLKYEKGDNTI